MGRYRSRAATTLHDALYRAYFVDARNIGDPDILVEIAESVGLAGDGGARGARRAPLQGRGRRRLGEIARNTA